MMKYIDNISDLKKEIKLQKGLARTIGFVPTMGYLHEGHLSLMKRAKEENQCTVLSIFVNPTQFGPNEDFLKYPRDMERDLAMAKDNGVDIVFAPSIKELYPSPYKTYVNVEGITEVLCGASRPGHFRGVTTIVNKLFHLVEPDRAYFGQKDAQQVAVIERMVTDLHMDVEIVTCPIVRERDGLAMSSRNVYLSEQERQQALVLSRSLFKAEEMIKNGEKSAQVLKNTICDAILKEEPAGIDYVEIMDFDALQPLEVLKGKILIALAVRFGKTRLIDNIVLEV